MKETEYTIEEWERVMTVVNRWLEDDRAYRKLSTSSIMMKLAISPDKIDAILKAKPMNGCDYYEPTEGFLDKT